MSIAVINTSQLVTLKGPERPRVGAEMRDLHIIENGALFARNNIIKAVGSKAEIEKLITDKTEVIDAEGRVVLPGFVDAHTHPVFAGTRVDEFEMRAEGKTYLEISQAGGGINSTVRKTRAVSDDDLFEISRRYTDWFLRTGTTTIEAKSGYGLSLEDELKMLRVIRALNIETELRYIPTFLGAHTIPFDYKGRESEYVDLVINEMLPAVAAKKLAQFCDVFCEKGSFSVEDSRKILLKAKELGLDLRVHADQLSLGGGSALAAEVNAITADHLEFAGLDEIKLLKKANVQPVLLPASVLMIGSHQYPNARTMINEGLAVVIATDFNPGSSPVPSMPLAISLACTQMKMTPAEAITACTINAAYSLNLGDYVGSLEVGKLADFVIHDCDDYREIAYFTGLEHAYRVFYSKAPSQDS